MRGALAMEWKIKKRNKTKKKLKQGGGAWWCVGACRERGRTVLRLFRTQKKNKKALSSYSFFDWIPPFFIRLSFHTHKTKPKIPNYTNNQPCVFSFFPSLIPATHLSSGAIWWSFATRQCNQSDSIPRRNTKASKETKQPKAFYFCFSSPPLRYWATYYSNFPDEFSVFFSFLPLPLSSTEMKQMAARKKMETVDRHTFAPIIFYVPVNDVMKMMAAVCWEQQRAPKKVPIFTPKKKWNIPQV